MRLYRQYAVGEILVYLMTSILEIVLHHIIFKYFPLCVCLTAVFLGK